MDIEHLTKSQIVMLTLLVAFVSSIATAIITVTLVEQAPPGVTQTINRIVERTVERVVPNEDGTGTEIIKETTIVNEGEYIAGAVEHNASRIVRIYQGTTTAAALRGVGVIVAKDGIILTALSVTAPSDKYYALTYDGVEYAVAPYYGSASTTLPADTALLRLTRGDAPLSLPATTVGGASKLKLGSAVFSLSGKERLAVATGIIESVDAAATTPLIETTVNSESILFGSPLFTATGDLVGLHTSASYEADRGGFIPVTNLTNMLY